MASGAVPGSGRRGEPRRHAPRVHGVPSEDWIRRSRSLTCRGLAMDLSCTSRTPSPVTRRIARLRSLRVAAVRKAPRSADLDLAKESGTFHRRGSADGWARTIAIGSPATGPMCPQIKSPLLRSSITAVYQYICANTLARYPLLAEAAYRLRTPDTAQYRDIRANIERTWKPEGLDQYGGRVSPARTRPPAAEALVPGAPLERPILSVISARIDNGNSVARKRGRGPDI